MLSPGFVVIAEDLGVSIGVMSQSTAWAVLSIGLSLFLVSPIAKVYGRRPMFMLSAVVMVATSMWGSFASTYPSLLGARVVAGIGMAPYETLVQCIIGDIYFVHERATRIAFWNVFLVAGLNGGSTVSGYIIEAAGFRWAFGVCAIIFGVLTISTFFLIPETAYRRDILAPVVTVEDDGTKGLHMRPKYQINLQGDEYEGRYLEISARERKHTLWERLRIFNGRYSSSPLWKVFLRSFVMVFYPAVLWAFLSYGSCTLLDRGCGPSHGPSRGRRTLTTEWDIGITISVIVMFSVVNPALFAAPPYNFTVSQIGLTSLAPFIMCTLGYAIAGPLNDFIVVYLTRQNRGIYGQCFCSQGHRPTYTVLTSQIEPEFRLPLMVISLVLGVTGFFGFGITVHLKTHWLGPVLSYGCAYTSMVFMMTCVFGYVLDSYRKHNAEAFVAINLRNTLTFGLVFTANPWLERHGPLKVFCILGGLFTFFTLTTIPLW